MKRILVTGAGGNASQNFIASLRMADEDLYLVGTDANPYHLACADLEARYMLPRCDQPGYWEALMDVLRRERVELLHVQPDAEVAWLSARRTDLPVRYCWPSHTSILLCHDKMRSNHALKEAGVPVPESFRIQRISDLPDVFGKLIQKADRVWLRAVRGAGSRAALPVTSVRQAREWIHYWRINKGLRTVDFMLAEFLPGKEFAFQSLWFEGQLVTSMARERMEYIFGNIMPSGQSSSPSIARTVHRDDVNQIGTHAVQAVDERPHGVYCVDMKENIHGQPCVTEINIGRFFTTCDFFSAAGCNMPYYYVKLAFGEDIPTLPPYNAVEPELYWVRGVDRQPRLFRGAPWTAQSEAA